MADLRRAVRECMATLNGVGPTSAAAVMEPIRIALAKRGLVPGCHVGRKDLADDPEATLEWYAGQILAVIDGEQWLCVNSLINCVDKFAPEKRHGGV